MNELPILVHVGLPKAASTSLQHIFARTTSHLWLGKDTQRRYACPRLHELMRYVFPIVDNDEFQGESIAAELESYFEKAAKLSKRGLLLSEEILSGAGFVHYSRPALDLCQIAMNFKKCFGERLRLVVVIREQRAYLRSYYMQLVKQGASFDFETFVSLELERHDMRVLGMLDYSKTLAFLEENEISHSFHLFEELVRDETGLSRFLGILGVEAPDQHFPKMNRTHPNLYRLLRLVNRVFPRELGKRESLVSPTNTNSWLKLSDELENRLRELWPQFNRDLAQHFEAEKLKGYGYLGT